MKKLLTALSICFCVSAFSGCDLSGLLNGFLPESESASQSIESADSSSVEESSEADTSQDSEEHVHEWDGGTLTKNPACEEKGEMTYSCACGESYTEEVAALGHAYENRVCTACGWEYFSAGLQYKLLADGSAYEVTKIGECTDLEVVIPRKYEGLPVTGIANYAFRNRGALTSVIIPASVTSIGESAFEGCESLTSVDIPASVVSMGQRVFSRCNLLTSITVSNDNPAYQSIHGNLYTKDGTTLIQYTIGKTETSFTIPDFVTNIDVGAFSNCGSLISVEIPNSVTRISSGAFSNCSLLTSVEIPDSVTSIERGAFSKCGSLISVAVPDSVTSIGAFAWAFCDALTSVEIGSSVTNIDASAFEKCTALTNITVSEDNTMYQSIDGNLYTKGGEFLKQYATGKTATSFTVPDTVTVISDYALYACVSLERVVIPDSVTKIGECAFADCESLVSVEIGESVRMIDGHAFRGCYSLINVKIPDSVERIGEYAFADCEALTSLEIGDSVTSIGDYAFETCESLTSVVIPESVESIGYRAFSNCDSLVSLTFSDTSTWYRTDSYTYWEYKKGGTETDLSDASANVKYFGYTYSYANYYWYKL